jgi:hypothetical protein
MLWRAFEELLVVFHLLFSHRNSCLASDLLDLPLQTFLVHLSKSLSIVFFLFLNLLIEFNIHANSLGISLLLVPFELLPVSLLFNLKVKYLPDFCLLSFELKAL